MTMLLRSLLVAVALAAFVTTPASASAADELVLADLKPCYVAAREDQTEPVLVDGAGFTPTKQVDIYIDEVPQKERPTVDIGGKLYGTVSAPFIEEGDRPFTLRVSETRDDGVINSVSKVSRVTRLSVIQSPSRAATRARVRFRGRGFTDFAQPVYAHYVFAGKSQKTVRIGMPTGSCGLFSVKRKQFPFKNSPRRGVWTIQFDQEAAYNAKAGVRFTLTVRVRKAVKPQRARAR
jgi:hypothetical protein